MTLAELAAKIVEAHPRVPAAMATQVLRTALKTLRDEVEAAAPGTVAVPLLGQFRIRHVEAEKDGQAQQVRRTLFVAAKPRPASEEGDAAAVKPAKAGKAPAKAVAA